MADGNRRSNISAEDYALALDDRPAALMTRPVVPRERADRDVDETIAHYLTEAGEEAPASLTCRLLTPAANLHKEILPGQRYGRNTSHSLVWSSSESRENTPW
jgi:hypothetical protein